MAKYEVVHPVKTDKIHPRGSVVELSAKDGVMLTSSGHVKPLLVAETDDVVDLETFTKDELVINAAEKLDLTLKPSIAKASMIEAIRIEIAETGK